MTCIVGIIDRSTNSVIIGGDSAECLDNEVLIRKDSKVFKVKDFLIGCTSSFRMMQLLRYSFNPPEIKTSSIHQYMCTDFINAVKECFTEGGYIQKFDKGDIKGASFWLVTKTDFSKLKMIFRLLNMLMIWQLSDVVLIMQLEHYTH